MDVGCSDLQLIHENKTAGEGGAFMKAPELIQPKASYGKSLIIYVDGIVHICIFFFFGGGDAIEGEKQFFLFFYFFLIFFEYVGIIHI